MPYRLILLLFCFLAANLSAQKAAVGYDYENPVLISTLPGELAEISGLSVSPDRPGELLAVADELGKVYRLNAESGTILWSVEFWKDGDYEGIECVGDDIWVVKSTGTLYRISHAGLPNQETTKYNGHLNGDNNVEGLAYDAARRRLLLACKEDAKDDGNDKKGRYVFSFDLNSLTFSEEPVYAIEQAAVNQYLGTHPELRKYDDLSEFFDPKDDYDLSPSALAVHPQTGDLYLTSSVGKIIMVMSPAGEILELHRLKKSLFAQPEGLAFTADGTLYISTEAKGSAPARLYRLPQAR